MEEVLRWMIGFIVALVIGHYVAKNFLVYAHRRFDFEKPEYVAIPGVLVATVEGVFFTLAVAFELSGVTVAMIGWVTAKMAAHWNLQKGMQNIEARRITSLLASLLRLTFAMVGGLICGGKIWI